MTYINSHLKLCVPIRVDVDPTSRFWLQKQILRLIRWDPMLVHQREKGLQVSIISADHVVKHIKVEVQEKLKLILMIYRENHMTT